MKAIVLKYVKKCSFLCQSKSILDFIMHSPEYSVQFIEELLGTDNVFLQRESSVKKQLNFFDNSPECRQHFLVVTTATAHLYSTHRCSLHLAFENFEDLT